MGALTCISDYLKLCGQPHNLRYVAMSVMWFIGFQTPPVWTLASGNST
jgi:hypothetical protein